MIMASEGREDLIEATILSSNYSDSDIEKTASEKMTDEQAKQLSSVLRETVAIQSSIDEGTPDSIGDATEKVALLGSLISKGVKTVGKSILGAGKIGAGIAGKAVRNPGKAGAVGLGVLGGADVIAKTENNREKIVDGLI